MIVDSPDPLQLGSDQTDSPFLEFEVYLTGKRDPAVRHVDCDILQFRIEKRFKRNPNMLKTVVNSS